METKTLTQKQELIDWIASIENTDVIYELLNLKRQATFDFDQEFKKGITVEQFRTAIKERIRNYPWKQ